MSRPPLFHVSLLWLLLLGIVGGCSRSSVAPAGPIEAAERDSIVAFIGTVNQESMRTAFERLEQYEYARYLRTEQYDGDDFLIAYMEHDIEAQSGPDGRLMTVTQSDSAGAFDFGFFNQFVSENVDNPDPVDLVPWLLGEAPVYLNPRNKDKYSFRMMGDTLLWDRSAMIVEVRAKPDVADGLNVRKVRYYVDQSSRDLVAMYLERIDLGLLFREESTFYMHIQLVGGELVPRNTRFQTKIMTPFKGSYLIRTVSTYTDHRRILP